MNLEFNKICRLCLRHCEDYVDFCQNNGAKSLSAELKKTINFCYGLQVDLTDNLPTKVCLQCIQVLTLFYTTKNNVVASEQLLKDILSIRNNYESNKAQPFFNCKSDTSYDLEVEDEETRKSSHNVDISEIINKTSEEPISLNSSNHVNSCHDFSQLECDSDLVCNHKAESEVNSEELATLKETDSKFDKHKEIEESHNMKGDMQIIRTLNQQQNINFLVTNKSFNKLRHASGKEKTSNHQGSKKKGKSKPKKKPRIVKVIGTVIDENNILSPDVRRLRKETCSRLRTPGTTDSNKKQV